MNDAQTRSWVYRFTLVLTTSCVLLIPVTAARSDDVGTETCTDPACDTCVKVRPGDAIWMLDTRDIYCDCDRETDCSIKDLKVEHYSDTGKGDDGKGNGKKWSASSLENFLAEDDPAINTVIWVHGNRIYPELGRQRGLAMYGALTRQATDDRPIRYVIWSWPSTRIRGLRADVMVKAYRCDFEGLAVAEVLGRLNPKTSVGMLGFSFGARIISGAMHISAGGQLGDYRLAKRNEEPRKPYHAVFLAAAMDDDWLLPSRYHGLAVSQAGHMLMLNNSCDSVLKHYHRIDRCTRPCALGQWGLAAPERLGAVQKKILQHDIGYLIGSEHRGTSYIYTSEIMRMARQALVFD